MENSYFASLKKKQLSLKTKEFEKLKEILDNKSHYSPSLHALLATQIVKSLYIHDPRF